MPEVTWLDVMGLRAKVVVTDPGLAKELRRAWSACVLDGCFAEPDLLIEFDDIAEPTTVTHQRAISRDHSLAVNLERLTQTLTVSAIGALAGERLMLHACAIADESTSRCVVLVGPSGVGKTTVARTLGRRWSYVTDECVTVDDDGQIVPFPKPLSVISDGPPKLQLAPSELELAPATRQYRPVGLVLLRRDPDVGQPSVEEVSTVQAVALLAEHASYLARLNRPLARLAALVHQAGGLKVATYADAADLEPFVADFLVVGR